MEGEEFIDVHEGGESSWLQKLSDHIRLRGFRYEAHGDNMRIILAGGMTIDLESGSEGICFSTRTILPRGGDASEVGDYIDLMRLFLKITSLMPEGVVYVVDSSLESYNILNARRCVKTLEEAMRIIDLFSQNL
ncbi:MAG: hypothetical protein QXE32_05575 [Sulfolobales archaeon]